MSELQTLFNVISDPEVGLYSKSFEDFTMQFEDEAYQDRVFKAVSDANLYSKDLDSFKSKYAEKTVGIVEPVIKDGSLILPKAKDSKEVVRNLSRIHNEVNYDSDAVLKQRILDSYFDAPDVDLSRAEGARVIDSPMGVDVDISSIKIDDLEDIEQKQLIQYFGKEKYDLYKKYKETGDLNIQDIPENLKDGFNKVYNEEFITRTKTLKEQYARDNKDLIDESFYNAITIDEDVEELYDTDFIEKYKEIEKQAEEFKDVDDFTVTEFGAVRTRGVKQKQEEKQRISETAVKMQNKYLTDVYNNLNEDLVNHEKYLADFNIKTAGDLEGFLSNTGIDIETRKQVLARNNEIAANLNDYKKIALKFDDKAAALDALDKSYDWGYRAGLALEKAVFGEIGQMVLGVGAKIIPTAIPQYMIDEKRVASEYLKNNYVAHIDYNESLRQKTEANLPTNIKIRDLEWDNAGTFIGQQVGDNIFSVGTALTYAGLARTLTSTAAKRTASNLVSSAFFGVEGGAKLSEMEIAQNNAAENLKQLEKLLEDENLTPDERLKILEEKSYNEKALNYTQAQRAFSAITYGGIASYAEKIGTMRWIDDLAKMRKPIGPVKYKDVLKGTGNFILKAPGTEILEETATQVGHNLMDVLILKEDKSLIEGIDPDFFASVFVTSLAIGGPSVAGGVRNAFRSHFQTKEEIQKARDLSNEFIENQFILNEGTNLSGRKGINKKQADFIKARQIEILQEAGYNDMSTFFKAADLNADQITNLFDIARKQNLLSQKNFQIGNVGKQDKSLQKEREKLNKEYKDLQSEKEAILKDPATKREEKLKETAKEQGLDENIVMKRAFELGQAAYYDNLVKALGKKVVKFDGENALADLEKYLDDNNVDANTRAQIIKGFNEGSNGTFVGNDILTFERNRRETIVFGTDVQKADAIQVAVHELQHQYDIEQGLVKDGKILASHKPLVTSLKEHVAQLYRRGDITKKIYDQFKQRVDQYSDKVNKNKVVDQTELLTLLGTMKRAGMLREEKTSLLYEIKSLINKVRATILGENAVLLDIKTTSDVLRYIDAFNRKIEQGKVKAQLPPEEKIVVKQSKEASDNVQRIYEDRGVGGAFDIIEQFKPITNRLVEKRSQAPNFDRQLLTDEIETGRRGIFDLIREYDPKSGVPLAAFINTYLPARAIEASKRILGEEFVEDVTERVDIAAEEVTPEVKVKRKPKKIVLTDRFGVTKKVNEAIKKVLPKLDTKNLTFKKLKNELPQIIGEMFGISPKKLVSLANITKKELQAAQMFINKNADLLIQMLPEGSTTSGTATGVPNSLLKAFYTKTDRAKMAKTGSTSGLPIQIKNKINKKEFLEVFGIVDGKPDRTDRNTSARVLALANLTGKMMTNQAVRQNLESLTDQKQTLQNIKDGASSVMFSKGLSKLNLPDLKINDIKNGIENFDIFTDKIVLLSTYMPSNLIRAVDLRNFGITNDAVKDYARSTTLYEDLGLFTVGKSKDRDYLRPDSALGKNVKDITKSKVKKYNESGMANFNAMVEGIKKAIEANPNDKQLHSAIYMYLSSAVNDTSHPLRTGAEYIGGDVTATGKIIYEHALQNASVRDLLMDTLLNRPKDFNKTLKAIKKNYKLIALSEADAKAVDTAEYIDENGDLIKYKNGMGVGWDIFTDNWFDRYFNTDVNAVNPNNIKVIRNGKTFAQEYGVTKSGIAPIAENTKPNQVLSKAMGVARTTSYSKDSKGITVLDFDDTLATTKSLVKLQVLVILRQKQKHYGSLIKLLMDIMTFILQTMHCKMYKLSKTC